MKEFSEHFSDNFENIGIHIKNPSALFLDRDGVIIKDVGYISSPTEVVLEDGLLSLLKEAVDKKLPVIVITNQSGISRGYYSWEEFHEVNKKMFDLIGKPNPIIAIYANSHLNLTSTNWRKPNPYMIFESSKKYNINLKKSILIGDRITDMQAGLSSGITNLIHVETGHGFKEKEAILKFVDEEHCFSNNGFISNIKFLKNLIDFPYTLMENNNEY